jgi:hypothetical protein
VYQNLRRHRDIGFVSGLKEVHYFDEVHGLGGARRDIRTRNLTRVIKRLRASGRATQHHEDTVAYLLAADRDDEWYRRVFSLLPEDKVCGEITPSYSLLPPEGIDHVLRMNPAMKLFLLLRHPVDRAWSQVRFDLKVLQRSGQVVDYSVEGLRKRALADHNVLRTDFRGIVERFQAHVPPEQLMITFYDRIVSEPMALLRDLAMFLEVDPDRYREKRLTLDHRHNSAADVPLPQELAHELAELHGASVEWLIDNVDGVPAEWSASDPTSLLGG